MVKRWKSPPGGIRYVGGSGRLEDWAWISVGRRRRIGIACARGGGDLRGYPLAWRDKSSGTAFVRIPGSYYALATYRRSA